MARPIRRSPFPLLLYLTVIFFWHIGHAEIINVPADFPLIQTALNASQNGDTVLMQPGTYRESLYIPGHDVTLAGRFLLTGDTNDVALCVLGPPAETNNVRCIYALESGTTTMLRMIGLTINGEVYATTQQRGGLDITNRSLIVHRCVFDSCSAVRGGAVAMNGGAAVFTNTRLSHCGSNWRGTVLELIGATTTLEHCALDHDFATEITSSTAIYSESADLILDGCAIHEIGMTGFPGRTFLSLPDDSCAAKLSNCDIVNNRFHHFFGDVGQSCRITFDSNFVSHNEFFHDLLVSTMLGSGTVALIRGNTFLENTNLNSAAYAGRMFFTLAGANLRIEITGNLFLRNFNRENSVLTMGDDAYSLFTVRGNYIIENSQDAIANPPGGTMMLIDNQAGYIQYNIIRDNQGYAAFNGFNAFPPGYAQNNWWGNATGPYDSAGNPAGQGDTVEWHITYTPWEGDTSFMDTTESVRTATLPTDFVIGYAYPNPFNSQVTIEFAITRQLSIRLEVFDLLGRRVETLTVGEYKIGIHRVVWQADGHSSGIYFARLTSAASSQPPEFYKLILLK
ncbi:MAG: T9SS type A sorting domain-containing protein [Calditrichota bacterium]